jgi:tetratricopeptide (TPR) repeat protein
MIRKQRVARHVVITLAFVLFCGRTDRVQCQVDPHAEDTLGVVEFPVSCAESSRAELNHAMALLHHMTYPQAGQMFQQITEHDPGCAMAYWGIAMTLFQPVWPTRPGPADLQRGWELTQKAVSLNPASRRDQLLIDAAEGFFRDPQSGDYWKRIHAWAQGMEACYAEFPRDHEVAALYALALVATIPPDQISSPNNAHAADILQGILKENPQHPGAMHYLIHANDAPGREHESLEILREYEAIAPHNPHALHMPTHIYTRLGNWPEVIRGNIKAANAALDFPAGDHGQYVWDEFPHAIEYMIYAYLQMGADDSAAAQLKRLQGTDALQPSFKTAFHLSSTRARYALERQAWGEAASIMPREPGTVNWDKLPWPEAIGWFARGLGSAHTGNSTEAQKSLNRLQQLEDVSANAKEELFRRNTRVLRLELMAWLLHSQGMSDSSVTVMRQAAQLETSTPKHPVTPGGTLPAYELLGDLLLEQGKSSEAFDAYTRSLEMYPGRFNSLLGAARSARAIDSLQAAGKFYRQLADGTSAESGREGLREARDFLSR